MLEYSSTTRSKHSGLPIGYFQVSQRLAILANLGDIGPAWNMNGMMGHGVLGGFVKLGR